MHMYDSALFKFEATRFWLDRLIKEREEDGAYHFDLTRVEMEAVSPLERGFYLVRFSLGKIIEAGILPFMIDEYEEHPDGGIAYVFVRNTGKTPPERGILYETEEGKFVQIDFWGDWVRAFS